MLRLFQASTESSTSDFDIFVTMLSGETISLRVSAMMNVMFVKILIESENGITTDKQRLIFLGKQLQDETTLSDCNIKEGSILNCVLCLRGGMYHFTSGRLDYAHFSNIAIDVIQAVFQFQISDIQYYHQKSLSELQNLIQQSQNLLSRLFHAIEQYAVGYTHSNIKTILLSNGLDNENEVDDESSTNQ